MRILMFNNEFPPLGGGTATVNLMLFREWAKEQDLTIDLITSGRRDLPRREQFSERITIYRVPVNQRNPHHATHLNLVAYTFHAFFKAIRLSPRKHYDLTMAWSTVPAGVLSLLMRIMYGRPYVVRVGGSDVPGHEQRYDKITRFLTPLIRHTWLRARNVVVKCDTEREKVLALEPAVALETLANGVDTELFSPAPRSADGDSLRLIIVARLIEHKGHRVLFEALKRALDRGAHATLNVVGTGDSEHDFKTFCEELGIAEQVHFTGYVARENVAEHYRSSDVFVLPSEGEGMSISTLEAMACGLALLVTPTGGTDTLLESGVNGLSFEVGESSRLADLILMLANDPARAQTMGKASRQRAALFSWKIIARDYQELFSQC